MWVSSPLVDLYVYIYCCKRFKAAPIKVKTVCKIDLVPNATLEEENYVAEVMLASLGAGMIRRNNGYDE